MNVLFFTIDNVISFQTRSIYMDLVNKFINEGHYVTVISVCEKRNHDSDLPRRITAEGGEIIKVFSPNITKVSNYLLKGLSLVCLYYLYKNAARKAIKEHHYDLIVYGSPPVTVYGAIEVVKKKTNAYCYLLLKDIWPYDLMFGGVLSTKGWKGAAFNILRGMARKLYRVSDTIGCMSPANITFLSDHEPNLDRNKIEENPNSITPFGSHLSDKQIKEFREKHGVPTDKVVFVFGGNLGVAQGIDFALEAVKASSIVEDAFFIFVGSGTAKEAIEKGLDASDYSNFLLLPAMSKDDYDQFVYCCDVGLIFLNHDCLAPNYPSRLLSYMQAGLPVLCATDAYTDVGRIAEDNQYGLWCESSDVKKFVELVNGLTDSRMRKKMGENAESYFKNHYTSDISYSIIVHGYNKRCK